MKIPLPFGWSFTNNQDELKEKESQKSFAPPILDDGAINIEAGGIYSAYIDLEGTIKTDAEIISRYRTMALQPEIDNAVNEIVNESIIKEENKDIVELNLDQLEVSDKLKKYISAEFDELLYIMDFENIAYDMFRRWYIDGRSYFHAIIDMERPEEGIKELRYIDPRTIRKIRQIEKKKDPATGAIMHIIKGEYYIYNSGGFNKSNSTNNTTGMQSSGIKIQKDSIIHITSGLMDSNNTSVLSYLHSAIKFLNELRALEDASIIYHLSRAPERRIFNVDVGGLPRAQAEQHVRNMMTKHKNKIQYNAVTGEHTDNRKFMCYALDTKIPLLDGRTLEIRDIIEEYQAGKTNWVYSCDPTTGAFVPGPVSWAGVTKKDSTVVRVTFDNGKSVVCTPDHKFPVWDKGFVEAQHLQVGESMIPGYRRMKKIHSNSNMEYEQIYKNDTGTWEYTHREVAKWGRTYFANEYTYSEDYLGSSKNTVHHVNYNNRDNTPTNLAWMNYHDHKKYHAEMGTVNYTNRMVRIVQECAKKSLLCRDVYDLINSDPEIVEGWKAVNREYTKNRETLIFSYRDLRRICEMPWKQYCRQFDTREREANGRVRRGTTNKYSNEWKSRLSEAAKDRIPYSKTWKITDPSGKTDIVENLNAYCRERGLNRTNIKHGGSKGYRAEVLKNHKVVSVEFLENTQDVAALTIDQDETYHSHHTYLLDAGVYTKNTMLEDFWFPKRTDGSGTTIDVLQGGTQLSQLLESIEYFQNRLYKSLQVPITRLKPETTYTIGRSAEITRDEINFGKFIDRIRGKFSELFYEVLEKQLILKEVVSPEDWKEFKKKIRFVFCKDSYWGELKEQELLSERLSRVRDIDEYVGKYVSAEKVRKDILKQTDEEYEIINKQMQEESADPRYMSPLLLQMQQEQQQQAAPESNPQQKPEEQ